MMLFYYRIVILFFTAPSPKHLVDLFVFIMYNYIHKILLKGVLKCRI